MSKRVKNVKMHGPIGAYEYLSDNSPLEELSENDILLQKQVDLLYKKLQENASVDFKREEFTPLKPYTTFSSENTLFVKPGSFLCRIPTKSGPFVGKTLGSGINSAEGGAEASRHDADLLEENEFHNMGESQRTATVFFQGGSVSFDRWSDADFNYAISDTLEYTPDPPEYRLDLVCVQGFPADDQFGKHDTVLGAQDTPWLTVVKGAGFRNSPTFDENDEPVPPNQWFNGKFKDQDPRITYSSEDTGVSKFVAEPLIDSPGLTSAKTYGMGQTSVESISPEREYGTVPAPDDILNSSFKIVPGLTEGFEAFVSSTSELADKNTDGSNQVGVFTIPIAYVKIPRGFDGGRIQSSWVKDIRPLFRSAELTVSERQAIANSYQAQASNRILTVLDSDYQELVNYILQEDQWNVFDLREGQRDISLGNHEGRLKAMEAAIDRPKLQAAPRTSFKDEYPSTQLRPSYPANKYQLPVWTLMWGAGPKTWQTQHDGTGMSYHYGLYYSPGQYIPCVRNYLDRFYHDRQNPTVRADNLNSNKPARVYGAEPTLTRRVVVRKPFLTYATDKWYGFDYEGGDPTEYPARVYRFDNQRPISAKCYWPDSPAKWDDTMTPPDNRYKFQHIELDFIFPDFDPDRDEVTECSEVWTESCSRGRGWSGFGHGGSTTCSGRWVTKCNTYGGDKTPQAELPHWNIPLGWVPYFVDVDALGFVPGSIDSLIIEVSNAGCGAEDWGTFVFYRFNQRGPRWNGINNPDEGLNGTIELPDVDPQYLSLDERKGVPEFGTVGNFKYGSVGETQTWTSRAWDNRRGEIRDWRYRANHVSTGYSGFCLMVNMPIDITRTKHKSSRFFGLFSSTHYTVTKDQGYREKRCKIKISGPAHRYYNGAFLPTEGNSDTGDSVQGQSWID